MIGDLRPITLPLSPCARHTSTQERHNPAAHDIIKQTHQLTIRRTRTRPGPARAVVRARQEGDRRHAHGTRSPLQIPSPKQANQRTRHALSPPQSTHTHARMAKQGHYITWLSIIVCRKSACPCGAEDGWLHCGGAAYGRAQRACRQKHETKAGPNTDSTQQKPTAPCSHYTNVSRLMKKSGK